jgi:hypothetical protein
MAGINESIIQKQLENLLALEEHLYQAFRLQALGNHAEPEISRHFKACAALARNHYRALSKRLEQLGKISLNQPVKEAAAATLGMAAGLLDKMRSEEASKDLRDDYAALNLELISCLRLHTVALALGDPSTAELVAEQARTTAQFILELQELVPELVVRDLQRNHSVQPIRSALEETRQLFNQLRQATVVAVE